LGKSRERYWSSCELSFVFGEADVTLGVCIISLVRLRQEFYGLLKNENLFLERALKEAVHELGHTYRLGHCGDTRCIMHFQILCKIPT
jgi:archaemetzincin